MVEKTDARHQYDSQSTIVRGNFACGCAGFTSPTWVGNFYPSSPLVGHDSDRQLEYYQQHFRTVEINSTFYGIPTESTVMKWKKKCAQTFHVIVKAPRSVTHESSDQLNCGALLLFLSRMKGLGSNLTCVLIQCPRKLIVEASHLEDLHIQLKNEKDVAWYTGKLAFEFRNEETYYNSDVRDIMAKYNYILVLHPDSLGRATAGNTRLGRPNNDFVEKKDYSPQPLANLVATTGRIPSSSSNSNSSSNNTNFIYLRLHGPNDEHRGEYNASQLEEIAQQIHAWRNMGWDVFAFFLNDLEPTNRTTAPNKLARSSSTPDSCKHHAASLSLMEEHCSSSSSPKKRKIESSLVEHNKPWENWCAMPKNAKQLEYIVYQLTNESIPNAPKKVKCTLRDFFGGKKNK